MAPTPNAAVLAPEQPTRWDWWPLARLLTVLSVFGALAYFRFGWRLNPAQVLALPRNIFEVLSLFTLLSSVLAHLYLVLLMLPLYAVVTLNDTFYDASVWLLRATGIRSNRLLAGLGLCGETALFGLCVLLLRAVFHGPNGP